MELIGGKKKKKRLAANKRLSGSLFVCSNQVSDAN